METKEIPFFTLEKVRNFRTLQDRTHVSRTVDGDYEPVNYSPGSSVRFWVNIESRQFDLHWHASTEIIVPIVNNVVVHMRGNEYTIYPGEIFIIPPGELHSFTIPETGIRLVFLFDLSVLQTINGFPYLNSTFSNQVLITRDNVIYHKCMELLYEMFQDYYSSSSLREVKIFSKMIDFYVSYQESQCNFDHSMPKRYEKNITDRLNIVFFYINQHYTEDIPLEKAAEIAGFSKYHFSRIFKDFAGNNYFDYLCLQRIKASERMLLIPGKPITEIAYQSGFGSLCAFNRAFKKKNNCTPSEYRSKHSAD